MNGNDEGLAIIFLIVITIILLVLGFILYFMLTFTVSTWLAAIIGMVPVFAFWTHILLSKS